MLSILHILKALVLLFLLGSTGLSYGISLKSQWGSYYGGDPYVKTHDSMFYLYLDNRLPSLRGYSLNASACDSQGNLYIVGKDKRHAGTDSASLDCDAFVVKFSAQGELQWKKSYGSTVYDEATAIGINSKNEIYVAGWLYQDYFFKPNKYSHYDETKDTDTLNYLYYIKMLQYKKAENFPIKYQAGAHNADTGAMFVLKLNPEGETLWSTLYGPQQINSDSIFVVMQPQHIGFTKEDDYYINGCFISQHIEVFFPNEYSRFNIMPGKHFLTMGPKDAYIDESPWAGLTKTTFVLKLNAYDRLIWSTTIPLSSNTQDMKIDAKGNLFLLGHQADNAELKLKRKDDTAYFFKGDPKPIDTSTNLWFYYAGIPLFTQFDTLLRLAWNTHIAELNKKDLTDGGTRFILSGGLWLSEKGSSVITGDVYSENYPLVEKEGAYFWDARDYINARDTVRYCVYLSEFNSIGKMIWSTYYKFKQEDPAYDHIHCGGYKMIGDQKGGFYLLGSYRSLDSSLTDLRPIPARYIKMEKNLFLAHFDKDRRLLREEFLPLKIPGGLVSEYLKGNEQGLVVKIPDIEEGALASLTIAPNLSLSLSPAGSLFITGNTKNIEPSLLKQPNSNSYFQSSMRSAVDQVAGFMLSFSLCDSLEKPIVWAMDSAYCQNEIIDIQLSLPADSFPSSYIYWHSSLGDSVQSDSFYIQKAGWYFSEIRSVYTDCPSFFSDTLFIDTIPIPQVNFGIDSLELCAQDRSFVLTATNPFAQYLWSNGSTDSIFQVKYKGMAEFWIWGEAYTRCGDTARDSVFVQFLPPYAYLGEDTMLCPNERFYFDIAAQNEEYKELLAYRWKINGDTLNLPNTQGFLQIDESFGDTILLEVEVYFSLDTLCDRVFDTVQIIYYRYLNVYAFVEDTIICQSDDAQFSTELAIFGPDAKAIWRKQNGELISQDSSVLLQEEGNYILSLKNYCSSSQDTFTLAYYPLWWTQANMPEDTFYCANQPLVLNPDVPHSSTRYRWEDLMEGQEDLWQFSASRVFDKAGNYSLELKDSAGCMESYTLNVQEEDCAPVLNIPNVFTPNGDGFNDILELRTAEKIFDFEIKIYNTYGRLVHQYTGEPMDFRWDAFSKLLAQPLPDGTYYWIALFRDYLNKKKKENGIITILR